jgi:hypothetical protein
VAAKIPPTRAIATIPKMIHVRLFFNMMMLLESFSVSHSRAL